MSLGSFTEKWSCKIISNYFLLYAINGFLGMIGLISIAKLDLLIMLAATVITFFYLRHQITTLDAFIIFFIASIAFSGLFQNYNKDLWYAGCRGQLYYTIFFFVGRYSYYMNLRIIKNGLYPFLFVCVPALGWALGIGAAQTASLLASAISLAFCIAPVGLIINLCFPKLDAPNPTVVIKQSAATLVGLLAGFALLLPGVVLYRFFAQACGGCAWLLMTAFLYIVVCVASWRWLLTRGTRLLYEL